MKVREIAENITARVGDDGSVTIDHRPTTQSYLVRLHLTSQQFQRLVRFYNGSHPVAGTVGSAMSQPVSRGVAALGHISVDDGTDIHKAPGKAMADYAGSWAPPGWVLGDTAECVDGRWAKRNPGPYPDCITPGHGKPLR